MRTPEGLALLSALAAGTVLGGAARAAVLETRIGLLDAAVGVSDGVEFRLSVLDAEKRPLATLLARPVAERGLWVIRRNLGPWAGQSVWLQLEATPGPKGDVSTDWAVWQRPRVLDAQGSVLLDMRAQIAEGEVGYVLNGMETVVGNGVQCYPDGQAHHGICVWCGERWPYTHPTLNERAFVLNGRPAVGDVLFTHPIWSDGVGNTFVRFRLDLPAEEGDPAMPADEEYKLFTPAGFGGTIEDGRLVPESVPAEVRRAADGPPSRDLSLTDMAAKAMHYLTYNPSRERDYECRFGISPLSYPPYPPPDQFDFISLGDTESRMDWEWIYMREVSGSDEGREVEQAIWKRLLGYVRDDGLSWLPPYCLNCNDSDHEAAALGWTTGETIVSLVERYVRTGDRALLDQAGRMVRGLRELASWDTGRTWYPGGLGGWRDGQWMMTGCSDQLPCILHPVCRYYEVSGDEEALAFARAMADGFLAGLQQNLGANRIGPDGSFGGYNCHLHMRAVLGVAHLGALTHDPRYIEWARRPYQFLLDKGTDWGWFPESVGRNFSETCATGDMTDVAVRLAQAGYPEYWDHVERFVRNYCRAAQFAVTPEFEARYRAVHQDNPEQAEAGLRMMRNMEGGFVACLRGNDWVVSDDGNSMNMMGCCPPEGMRAVYLAWSNTVTEDARGVWVHMSLNRDAPQAQVVSYLPDQGRLTVVTRRAGDFHLRPPAWTPRGEVRAYRDGQEAPAEWSGDYVRFAAAREGEELTLTYPLVRFTQRVAIGPDEAPETYTYTWLGNAVLSVEPRGQWLPIFTGGA